MRRDPGILERLSIKGALVTIDAIATTPTMATAITAKGGDYILGLKRNQPTLHDEVATSFADPATTGLSSLEVVDKDHGRIETRTTIVSHDIGWMTGDRRHPGEHRFPGLACLISTTTQVERKGKVTRETRYFIASAALTPHRAAEAIRSHWHREPPLGARRHLQGGPIAPAARPRRHKHGFRPTPRVQHGARRKR